MADKKPNILSQSSKVAQLFRSQNPLNNKSMFSSKKEQEKPPAQQAHSSTNENQKKETPINIFLDGPKPSGMPLICDNPPKTTKIFTKDKNQGSESEPEIKLNPHVNIFAQGETKPTINPFANLGPIIFSKKTDNQTANEKETNMSYQPNQSNIFGGDPSKKKFSLLQQNPGQFSSETSNQTKNLFGQINKGLFGSTGNMQMKGELFSSTNDSNSEELSGTATNEPQKGSLFGTLEAKEPNKNLLETTKILKSTTSGENNLAKSSSESQEESNTEPKKKKEKQFPSIVHEEKSQEDESSSNEIQEDQNDEIQSKRKQILNYLKQKKIKGEHLLLCSYQECQKKKLYKLQAVRDTKRKDNQELEQKQKKLGQEKASTQEKLKHIKVQNTNELSYKQIIQTSKENNPIKNYPGQDFIQNEIKNLTSVIQKYYFSNFSNPHNQKTSNPQNELIDLGQKIDKALMKKDHLLRQQKQLLSGNAQNLRKIQSREMFGDQIQVEFDLSESEKTHFSEMRQKLEDQLKRLREENQKKKKVFESKKTQLREYSPPKKIAEGRSSIIMKSMIYD